MKASSYYPPRAGSWSRIFSRIDRLKVRFGSDYPSLDLSRTPAGSLPVSVAWLLVPGLMWRQRGKRVRGTGVMALWAVLLVVHIVILNAGIANFAAILASGLHAVSAAASLGLIFPHWQGLSLVGRSLLLTTLLMTLIYSIGLRRAVASFAQRVGFRDSTVMIHRSSWLLRGKPWSRGEWVAYRLNGGALYLGRILACPGDTVRFHPGSVEVNGVHYERTSPYLPVDDELPLDPWEYLVLPAEVNFNHAQGNETRLLLALMSVAEDRLVGRPWRHWPGAPAGLEDLKTLSSAVASPPPTP